MSSLLEEIREIYLSKHTKECSSEALQAMDVLLEKEQALLETLTAEQKTLFFAYSSAILDYHTIKEADAFRQGGRCFVEMLSELEDVLKEETGDS